jgi:hypothetical protein
LSRSGRAGSIGFVTLSRAGLRAMTNSRVHCTIT